MTPREALDRIAALCNDADETNGGLRGWVLAGRVRAVLAEVSPEPGGGVLDRDQARPIVRDAIENAANTERTLDRLAGCVRPAAIDRDALTALIHRIQEETDGDADLGDWTPQYVAEFLALVRPVPGVWPEHPDQTVAIVDRADGRELPGVVLTPEEADLVRRLVTRDPRTPWSTRDNARLPALAARLEAAP